jgi:radical SAM superfamily enzyme YgiQ (UPF0313 family)
LGWPPLGLEIIAAVLEPFAEAIDVVDLRWEQSGTAEFIRDETDLICFSVNWPHQPDSVRDEIRAVPPGILTVVGGRHVTEEPDKWLAECPNIDILVRGDGEEVIRDIAAGRPLEEIPGISYRRDGQVVHNDAHNCVPVQDDLHPQRRLRRYSYSLDFGGLKGRPFDTIASSRGCPFSCKFCSFSMNPWGQKRSWSARSPESVVNEIEEMDADIVAFVDDIFTYDMARVEKICDLLIERGIKKRYLVNARLEIAKRPDVIRKMERAGFSMLLLGIESSQDKTLRAMKKGFDTRIVRKSFQELRKSRMLLLGYFILGNIGESKREMREMVPFARELGVDLLNLCVLRNETYSGLDEVIAKTPGYHTDPGLDRTIYSDACSVDDLRLLQRSLLMKFYSPGHVLHVMKKCLRNGIITPGMLARVPLWLLGKSLKRQLKADSVWGKG